MLPAAITVARVGKGIVAGILSNVGTEVCKVVESKVGLGVVLAVGSSVEADVDIGMVVEETCGDVSDPQAKTTTANNIVAGYIHFGQSNMPEFYHGVPELGLLPEVRL